MRYLLDTNVISELRKVRSGRADRMVAAWAATVPGRDMYLSAVTIHELEHGVLLLERTDAAQAAILREWLDDSVATAFEGRILPMDEAVARRSARLHVPDPVPYRDAFIGATALVHEMTLVTRNLRDFQRFEGLRLLNPWATQ